MPSSPQSRNFGRVAILRNANSSVSAAIAASIALATIVVGGMPSAASTALPLRPPSASTPHGVPQESGEPVEEGPADLVPADLDTWLDGFMPTALRQNDIAGAVVSVVKGGKVLSSRGFGVSDVETGAPVDPQQTLFRVASVSKTFVWTAVMQLVERGEIDLDADIGEYLDFTVRGEGGMPITVRHLMTHTAGFEETAKNTLFDDPSGLITLETYVKQSVPARIFEPGSTPAYSNYGAALAGYIVQRVSGQPFDEYIEQKIFDRLGMTSSSFRQPLPANLEARLSRGYDTASEPARAFEYIWDAPAGSLSTTAEDMNLFMIEHLQNETPGLGRLLDAAAASLMHRTVTRAHPGVNGMALGFYEQNRNGREVIGHGGDLTLFHTQMELYLDENVGIFVSYNSAGAGATDLRSDLMTSFADRYFSESEPDARLERAVAVEHANEVAGSYRVSRRPESSFLKVASLAYQATLEAAPDGSLTLTANGMSDRFVETEPYLWRQPGTDNSFTVVSTNGSMRMTPSPVLVFDRVSTFDTATVRGSLSALAILVLLIPLVGWPVAALIRRRYRVSREWKPGERRAVVTRRIASLLILIAAAAWLPLLLTVSGGDALDERLLIATQVFSIVSAVAATALAVIALVSTLRRRHGGFTLGGTLVWTLALGFLLVQYVDLNLLRVGTAY